MEHHLYLKKIFDSQHWDDEAIAIFSSTLASLYATMLVCVYIAFAFTELVTFPKFKVKPPFKVYNFRVNKTIILNILTLYFLQSFKIGLLKIGVQNIENLSTSQSIKWRS